MRTIACCLSPSAMKDAIKIATLCSLMSLMSSCSKKKNDQVVIVDSMNSSEMAINNAANRVDEVERLELEPNDIKFMTETKVESSPNSVNNSIKVYLPYSLEGELSEAKCKQLVAAIFHYISVSDDFLKTYKFLVNQNIRVTTIEIKNRMLKPHLDYFLRKQAELEEKKIQTDVNQGEQGQGEEWDKSVDGTSIHDLAIPFSSPIVLGQQEWLVQVSALNFLQGGHEPCNVDNVLIVVTHKDQHRRIIVCKNSQVQLEIISHAGVLRFSAFDVVTNVKLGTFAGSVNEYRLGVDREKVRFFPRNENGFSYLSLENVSGIDLKLLSEFNNVNSQLSKIKAKMLDLEKQGKKPKAALRKQYEKLEKELFEIKQKINSSLQGN